MLVAACLCFIILRELCNKVTHHLVNLLHRWWTSRAAHCEHDSLKIWNIYMYIGQKISVKLTMHAFLLSGFFVYIVIGLRLIDLSIWMSCTIWCRAHMVLQNAMLFPMLGTPRQKSPYSIKESTQQITLRLGSSP